MCLVSAFSLSEAQMPRYFFHVRDGHDMPDLDGTELPNAETARREAVQMAGRLIADRPLQFVDGTQWHIEVTNEADMILFRLDFLATDAPVSKRATATSPSSRAH